MSPKKNPVSRTFTNLPGGQNKTICVTRAKVGSFTMRPRGIEAVRIVFGVLIIYLMEQMRWWMQRSKIRRRRENAEDEAVVLQWNRWWVSLGTCIARRMRWYSIDMLPPHSCWEYPCSSDWWEKFVTCVWDNARCIKHFWMSRGMLADIAVMLSPRLQGESTIMRRAVPVFKRVAMAVWCLANVVSYRELSEPPEPSPCFEGYIDRK